MNAKQMAEAQFLSLFYRKNRKSIGVELEFPLLSLEGGSIADEVITGLVAHLLKNGFRTEETDIHGNSTFLINEDGDCLSFDNSYNNFEFAMAKNENLSAVANRFYKLYQLVQSFLLPAGHTLSGLGTNPHHGFAETKPVDYPIYQTLRQFLSGFSGKIYHNYTDFPAWLSSVQTHLDIEIDHLPKALTLFASMDFVRGLLFSNSLPFADSTGFDKTLCFRDYLWEHSGFGSLADNVGPVCESFKTSNDVINAICKRSMFLAYKGKGQYEAIPAVPFDVYFNAPNAPTDAEGYLSFKNVEITRRGTLEIRSDCAQPVGSAFAPPAFNLGIRHGLSEAEALMNHFFSLLPPSLANAPDRNARLRHMAIHGEEIPVKTEELKGLLMNLVLLADAKLKERGLGEETLLAPLFHRAQTLTCPAGVTKKRLQNGENMNSIIADYSNPAHLV